MSRLRRFVYRRQGLITSGVVAVVTLMLGDVCRKGWMAFTGVLFLSLIALFGLLLVRIVTYS